MTTLNLALLLKFIGYCECNKSSSCAASYPLTTSKRSVGIIVQSYCNFHAFQMEAAEKTRPNEHNFLNMCILQMNNESHGRQTNMLPPTHHIQRYVSRPSSSSSTLNYTTKLWRPLCLSEGVCATVIQTVTNVLPCSALKKVDGPIKDAC